MREKLSSRIGFLMLAAGCAVGLGNVWRFPFIAGENGGAVFVLVYLAFLLLFGLPVLLAELSVGRGGQSGIATAMRSLGGKWWGRIGTLLFSGNLLLMVYYTDVGGWLLIFTKDYALSGAPPVFAELVADRWTCAFGMLAAVAAATAVCAVGVKNGVERITKWMMISLLALMAVLAVKSLMLPGAAEGLAFYLKPDWSKLLSNPGKVVLNAMGQAFFTLSVGVGAMTIFGSYVDKRESLVKEAMWIVLIDTFVALSAGLVIFPACMTYDVAVNAGPGLIFEALPKVFAEMPGGRYWGFAFFLFLSLAALTTVIAVFECLIGGILDITRRSRLSISIMVGVAVAVLSLPCVCVSGVLEMEDFVFSKFFLPLGGFAISLFVSCRIGWGWENFRAEASEGAGAALPRWTIVLFRYLVPAMIIFVMIAGQG
jgi:NSS family neurotransmitter:Na+ symporter